MVQLIAPHFSYILLDGKERPQGIIFHNIPQGIYQLHLGLYTLGELKLLGDGDKHYP